MPTNDEDRVLQVLDQLECRRLLASSHLGRLGFTDGALPAIVPAPFTLDEDSLLIPASIGNWVVNAMHHSVVAFAVDAYDVGARTGWGVTVVGPSRVITHSGPVASDDGLGGGFRSAVAGRCSIVVQLGLLRGWRMSLPADTAPDMAGATAQVG